MVKVLHVIHGLNIGGAEGFIFNVIRSMSHEDYQFDFVIQNQNMGNLQMKEYIEGHGGKIFLITDFRKNLIKHISEYKEILKNGYDYVHIHNNSLINPIPVIYGNKYGSKVILHSHNTSNGTGGRIGFFIHKINRKLFIKKNTIRVACGIEAGKWMHGKNNFIVLHNAVDLEKFKFSTSKREEIRRQLGIKNELVIGHIGRFVPEKNQQFIIDFLVYAKKNHPEVNLKAILCGNGPLKESVEKYAHINGVGERIILTGNINNPDYYYSAFDCFVLPSLFEGLAFVAVEAQASGLPVVASSCNTPEIDITGNVKFLSLKDSFENWYSYIMSGLVSDREQEGKKLINSDYDLSKICEKLPY